MVALVMPGATAGAATLSEFSCKSKVVAIYRPGPHWSQFQKRLSDHLDYLKAQIDGKTMVYGAPLSNQSGHRSEGCLSMTFPVSRTLNSEFA